MSETNSHKLIKKGTGRIIAGDQGILKRDDIMESGHNRPSFRYIFWKNAPSGCIPYFNYEATFYAKIGDGQPNRHLRAIVTGGGGGQTGNNCCVYSVGFESTGKAFAEEEGQHDPHHT